MRQPATIQPSSTVTWLAAAIAMLSAAAASYGLTSDLYRHDTLLVSAGFTGVDAVTLTIAIPLLIIAIVMYRRGSVQGALLVTGTLSYFLYNYASMAFGAAYNELFLAYIAIFSASLFALGAAVASIDLTQLPMHVSPQLPRRTIALYLVVVGKFLVIAWGGDVIWSLATGRVPKALDSYTTIVTYALDLGVVAPMLLIAAVLLLRRTAVGFLLASTMLTVMFTVGAALIAQSAAIVLAGVTLTRGEVIGLVISFGMLCVIGIVLATVFMHHVSDEPIPVESREAA